MRLSSIGGILVLLSLCAAPTTAPSPDELARVICGADNTLDTRLRASDELLKFPTEQTIPAMLAHIPDSVVSPGDDPDKLVRAMIGQFDPHDLSPTQQASHAITQTMLKLREQMSEKEYARAMIRHREQAKSEWAREFVLNSVGFEWIDEAEAPLLATLRDAHATPTSRGIAAWRLIQHQRAKRYDELLALADLDPTLRPAFVERLLTRPQGEQINPLTLAVAMETFSAISDGPEQMLFATTIADYLGTDAPDFPSLNTTSADEIRHALQQWWTRHRDEYEPRAKEIRSKLPATQPS